MYTCPTEIIVCLYNHTCFVSVNVAMYTHVPMYVSKRELPVASLD